MFRSEKITKGRSVPTFVIRPEGRKEEMDAGTDNPSSLEMKDSELSKKEKRRLSVTFTKCLNIPDEAGSKSSLSKKYISSILLNVLFLRLSGTIQDPS